jgi:hypothetical protein
MTDNNKNERRRETRQEQYKDEEGVVERARSIHQAQ